MLSLLGAAALSGGGTRGRNWGRMGFGAVVSPLFDSPCPFLASLSLFPWELCGAELPLL